MQPELTIPAFDAYLAARELQYEGNPESRDQYWIPLARRQLARLGKELGYDVVL